MRVLIACYRYRGVSENLFVPEFVAALERCGIEVVWGNAEFWCPTQRYDLVHIQWPESLFDWRPSGDFSVSALKWRLQCWRDAGVPLMMTRHNETKHYADGDYYGDLYRTLEEACDGIVHLSEYSRTQMQRVRPDCRVKHYVIPHHVYPSVRRDILQFEARKRLGLSEKQKLALAFGAFRDDEERILVMDAMRHLRRDNVRVYAPRLFNGEMSFRSILSCPREFIRRFQLAKHGLYLRSCGFTDVETMSLLFAATDVVIIPRKKILNSGNLPMGFYFGKVVVGPDAGNVGEILCKHGNPVFDPNDPTSLAAAVNEGIRLSSEGLGTKNREFADREWHPTKIAAKTLAAYSELITAARGETYGKA